ARRAGVVAAGDTGKSGGRGRDVPVNRLRVARLGGARGCYSRRLTRSCSGSATAGPRPQRARSTTPFQERRGTGKLGSAGDVKAEFNFMMLLPQQVFALETHP